MKSIASKMSEFTNDQLLEIIQEHLPGTSLTGEIARLNGGNINYVWRAKGAEKNVIIKHAPPHIATNPDILLSDSRIDFEARALKLFSKGGKLDALAGESVSPPELYLYEEEHSLIIMEDVGDFQELNTATLVSSSPQKIGTRLGKFIGNLHRKTFRDELLAEEFHNLEIQKVRNQLQYQPAWEYAGLNDSELGKGIKAKSQDLGNRLLENGKCLVMGDLWPPSIYVGDSNEIRLIDWEFVHFGRPLQDVGHLAAHCWMQGHVENSTQRSGRWEQLWASFLEAYKKTTGSMYKKLIDDQELYDIGIHIGTEILMRTFGPFKEGYVFAFYKEDHSLFQNCKKTAINFVLHFKTSGKEFGF